MSDNDYEKRKVAPLNAQYIGATFHGVLLRGEEDTEPNELVLSFDGLPNVIVSVWHGMSASGFDIEIEKDDALNSPHEESQPRR